MHAISLFLIVFFSAQIYAGMEKTNACKKQIQTLKSDIDFFENQLKNIQTQEQRLDAKRSKLKEEKEKPKPWHIPGSDYRKKQKKLEDEIATIDQKIDKLFQERQTIEKALQKKQEELRTEEAKLKTYKSITIKSIEITAYGEWDTWDTCTAPEIRIKMGNSVIAKGAKDSLQLYKSCNEDATHHDNLKVYDKDFKVLKEDMGSIPLNKHKLPPGVSGDSQMIHLEYDPKPRLPRGISYKVEYEVKY